MNWQSLVLGALTSAVLAAGCAPPGKSMVASASSDRTQDRPFTRTSKVCYPGRAQAECLAPVPLTSLKEQNDLYQYPNPNTDSSFPQNAPKTQYTPPDRVLNLRQVPANLLLSPHFLADELLPAGADRGFYGLFSPLVVQKLESLRTLVNKPIRITSGYRSPGHNGSLQGAAKWSRHTYGDAVDFQVDGIDYKSLATKCLAAGANFYQLYTDHIHCDWRTAPLSDGFFPIGANPPTIAPLAKGRLAIRESEFRSLVLATEVDQEDAGQLTHEWRIEGPKGYFMTTDSPHIELPKTPGIYKISVVVGGSTVVTEEISQP